MATLSITADFNSVNKMLRDMRTKEVKKAATKAINTTLIATRKKSAPELQNNLGKSIGLSVPGLRKEMKITRARFNRLVGLIRVTGKALPLIRFQARKGAKGVISNAYGKRKVSRGAFIVTLASGRKGVFKRATKGGKRVARLPIKELYGPSIPMAFLTGEVQRILHRTASKVWARNFQRELDFYLRKVS